MINLYVYINEKIDAIIWDSWHNLKKNKKIMFWKYRYNWDSGKLNSEPIISNPTFK